MQSHEEKMKKREEAVRKDLQKFAEQEDSMTDEGNYLVGIRATMREKKTAGWLAEKKGCVENYFNFKSNGRASNEDLKRNEKLWNQKGGNKHSHHG